MKLNELRKGNIVYTTSTTATYGRNPVLVVDIDADHVSYVSEKHQYFCELKPFRIIPKEITPIPLSSSWLEGFGFTDSKITLPSEYELEICLESNTYNIHPFNSENELIESGLNISNVHELQNLYHAITGDELNLLDL
ncbi:hypothetical protein AQ505_16865 [Pedobacter sp. PACM 27299]|uniref:hypothetical protein n=1 Tax=Pedobacter sp. PACM 27299 TaxID=1727164 RepID=UPI00070590E2|nr:hypothetical protein [Pedobacter sp. PACM 27299]ALL07010.1 hypothetical protein AQ505_16865 [Pedobacter sp. PACM 27299]